MKQHRYRITIKHIADKDDQPPKGQDTLQFDTANHDDIFSIVARMRQCGDFDPDTATAFAVGLKLFGEVMLTRREHPLFAEFAPHFGDFMKRLKSSLKGERGEH